jgi:hypothetical protein
MSADLSRRAAALMDGKTLTIRFPESIEWAVRLHDAPGADDLNPADRKILDDGESVAAARLNTKLTS